MLRRRRPVPRQQFLEAALRQVGDTGEHVGEPRQWIDVIELCRLCRPSNYAERLWK
jgi:hypothetical protein